MNRKDVIEVLKMENDLITFDPSTGEDIDVRCLNDLNKRCYIAHEEAIEFLRTSIPIAWIEKWSEQFYKVIKGKRYYMGDGYDTVWDMLEDWKKENEESN